VDQVIALREREGPLSYARRLRVERPTAVLDLHGKIRSRILRALLPGVRKVVWTKRDFRDTLPVKLALRPYRSSMLFADRYHAAVEQLVGRALPRGRLRYFLGDDDVAAADAALRAAGLKPGAPLLGLSPGANWETKRWPVDRFAGLARRALARGLQVAVQGSAAEEELGARIAREAPGAVDLCGKLDLARSPASSRAARPSSRTTAGPCTWRARWASRRSLSSAPPTRRCSTSAATRSSSRASSARRARSSGGGAARGDISAACST
jgi:ADP-heptose:LPS heptosyltransferase